ncbi:MAG TPA: GWxTD domain-containing protein [Bacteroidia bacterium]|nr:GWxTD domain-containing protein [Bacteroidia bacterium]
MNFRHTKTLVFTVLLFLGSLFHHLKSQNFAYCNLGCFNTPQKQAFLESYLTIVGKTLASKEVGGGYQISVKIGFKLYSDTGVVLQKVYNVLSPVYSNSLEAPAFIDVQRYTVKNGHYSVLISLEDNNNPNRKPFLYRSNIQVSYVDGQVQGSSIELVERFQKADNPSTLSKSGFELVPYTVNYFPESINQLNFYFESYQSDTVIGHDKFIVYSYFIEDALSKQILENYGSFKKQKSAAVNPLLARIDISNLGSGTYYLVVELKDEFNVTRLREKVMFQRMNRSGRPAYALTNDVKQGFEAFFSGRTDVDSLKMFVECLWPIADGLDKERVINYSIQKEPGLMKNYVVDFWTRRAADTADAYALWMVYYKSVQEAMAYFKCGKQKGYYTDRGRVYLQYGKPSQRTIQNNEANTYPYEIWQYYRTTDASTGRFYSNRRFVFVNRAIADDCHQLIHSDMPGEFNNPRWQFEITRRNNEGKANLDNTTPAGTEYNQFNEIFSNPR